MQGGLITNGDATGPAATAAPSAPSDPWEPWPDLFPAGGRSAGQQSGSGASTSVDVEEMDPGPIMAAIEASSWTKDDVDLALSLISTALLIWFAYTEVR